MMASGSVLPPMTQPQLSLYPHIHGTSSDIVANHGYKNVTSDPNSSKLPMFTNPFLVCLWEICLDHGLNLIQYLN